MKYECNGKTEKVEKCECGKCSNPLCECECHSSSTKRLSQEEEKD